MIEAVLKDGRAYGKVVARYEAALMRYVRRLLGHHAASAEDVLQEVFVKAYLNINDFDRARAFAPWLYRIAHNEAVSYLRGRKMEQQTINGEDAMLLIERAAADSDPAADLEAARTSGEVRQALKALDARYRDVLVLRYLEEKSYDEIADILRLPPGTVATLIRRGLQQLKAPLRSHWGGP
jgi:RNA polymerase sigma-70 factor, ECF subfamily